MEKGNTQPMVEDLGKRMAASPSQQHPASAQPRTGAVRHAHQSRGERDPRDSRRESNRRERAKSSSDSSNDTLGARNFDELRHLEQGRSIGEFDWWGLSSKRDWVKIGKGGYGCVYKAKWYGKTVAIKEARHSVKGSARRALEREVDHLSRLSHPNVIHVFGSFSRKEAMYLVMEYVPHCLRDDWTASRVDMVRIMLQVARSLLFLHRKGVVHRDIKTRNICISADYKVAKLIDFGLAASLHSPTKELMRKVGTKKYRAPEVNGTTVQGFGVDIYSYGAMLTRICKDFDELSNDMSQVTKLLKPLAESCIDENPYLRPSSYEILQYLHQCVHRSMAMKESFGNGMIQELKSGALGLGRNLSDFRHCSDPLANVRLTDNERTDEAQSDRKEADSNLPPASKKMKQEQEH
jgi:serine/threonine protein kinase